MNEISKPERSGMSFDQYKELLEIRLGDISDSFFRPGEWFKFIVTPTLDIWITDKDHISLFDEWGVSDETYTEGDFKIEEGNKVKMQFKLPYQPVQRFPGSPEELSNLKKATQEKIEELVIKMKK